MQLQLAGLPEAQNNAMLALVNMQQALDGAEARVQERGEGVIQGLQEALNASEANNRLLAERIAQLSRENLALKQQNQELIKNNAFQKQAQEADSRAEKEHVSALLANINARCEQILNYTELKTKETIDTRPCSPYTARIHQERHHKQTSEIGELGDYAKAIQAEIKKFKSNKI